MAFEARYHSDSDAHRRRPRMTRYDPHPQDYDDARTGPQASREAAGRDETASRVSGGQGLRGALEALADYASTRGGDYQDQAGRHGRSAMGEAAAAAARAWWEASSRLRAVLAAHPAPEPGREQMEALIERSSLGTPEAKAIRDSVPQEAVDRVMARVRELEESETAADVGVDVVEQVAEPCSVPRLFCRDERGQAVTGLVGLSPTATFRVIRGDTWRDV